MRSCFRIDVEDVEAEEADEEGVVVERAEEGKGVVGGEERVVLVEEEVQLDLDGEREADVTEDGDNIMGHTSLSCSCPALRCVARIQRCAANAAQHELRREF